MNKERIYPFKAVEKKWQSFWENNHSFYVPENTDIKNPFYVLEMFPYPSGRLHMGHVRVYTIGDTLARFRRSLGHTVLHPMGWDSFGLPAENAAIEHDVAPATWTHENIKSMKAHFNSLGFSYDWSREIVSSDVSYYGKEQKLFLDFYKKGLAYQKESWVNWDPVENTVLANEQVINGRGWRSDAPVEKKLLSQWFLRITSYAEKLLKNLQSLSQWPESVRTMQENWIGKSKGATIFFPLLESPENYTEKHIEVFSTRPDTLFGASFIAVAPTHPFALALKDKIPALQAFIEECSKQDTSEATLQKAKKKGVFTTYYVQNPFNLDQHLPIYVANFVVMDYGTGAVFGCPGHDDRDLEFARLHNLPINPVILRPDNTLFDPNIDKEAYSKEIGSLVNSSFLNGLSVAEAKEKAINHLISLKLGKETVSYRLRDWGVSRQRYWGCPIPIIFCKTCGTVPVPEEDLPVELPKDISFDLPGNPLENHPTWKYTSCPQCHAPALRETDTLDTFFESSWYFFRYCSPYVKEPFSKEAVKTFMPVNIYVGGIEHAVLHLLYARFFTMALKDCGYLDFEEPFVNLITQGMVCHETYKDQKGSLLYPDDVKRLKEGSFISLKDNSPVFVGPSEKMSKSKKNVVEPSVILEEYGADTARLFMLSDTPIDKNLDWTDAGIEGCWRFTNRIWRLGHLLLSSPILNSNSEEEKEIEKLLHKTIAFVTETYSKAQFNTAIAQCRILTNRLEESFTASALSSSFALNIYKYLLRLFYPILPHITSELWSLLGEELPLDKIEWPKADLSLLREATISLAVQVNGKLRGTIECIPTASQLEVEELAKSLENVKADLSTSFHIKTIYVPSRIINFVVKK